MLRRGEGGDAEAGAAKGSWRPKSPTGALKPLVPGESDEDLRQGEWRRGGFWPEEEEAEWMLEPPRPGVLFSGGKDSLPGQRREDRGRPPGSRGKKFTV